MQEWLTYIFGYSTDPRYAFFFNRFDFWSFFIVALALFTLVYRHQRARNLYLLLFSLFFYYKSGGLYFLLLLFSTVVDYTIASRIFRSDDDRHRSRLVALSVIINLGVLAYFKYAYFFIENINTTFGTDFVAVDIFAVMANSLTGAHFDTASIFLPIGISFYTFQTISYTVDVYRKRVEPVKNMLDFAFYVSFFPQLVAGPIVRASDFVPQIYQDYRLTREELGRALLLIVVGMTKKILIADYLGANYVGAIFAEPEKFTGFQNLTAIYGFALQIYGDFSGYTDIAIGIALLLGFRLPLNFNSPYKSVNITDFWRRWHISLSSWLRDYLYIPLGGNRHGKLHTYKNLALTMLLGGLWHGAAWRFIFWGAMHGGALALHKLWMELTGSKPASTWWSKALWGFITFHFVCFCWIFFAAKDMDTGWLMLHQIGTNFYWNLIPDTLSGYLPVFIVMLIGFITHLLPTSVKEAYTSAFVKLPMAVYPVVLALVAFLLFQVMSADIQPFIYFQF